MSGQKVLRGLVTAIDKLGGEDYVFNQIRAGIPIGKIASSIVVTGHGPISRPFLYVWRNKGGEPRRKKWSDAMRESAHALAEEAGEVLDAVDSDPTSAQVSLARNKSDYKKWLADKRDPEEYGDKPSEVNVAIMAAPEAFVDALRKHGQRASLPAPTEEIPVADFEVLEEA